MTIAQIRDVIYSCEWSRNDFDGGTRDEFRRQDVGGNLAKHIAACKALVIPPRFAADMERCVRASKSAEAMIERWEPTQRQFEAREIDSVLIRPQGSVFYPVAYFRGRVVTVPGKHEARSTSNEALQFAHAVFINATISVEAVS